MTMPTVSWGCGQLPVSSMTTKLTSWNSQFAEPGMANQCLLRIIYQKMNPSIITQPIWTVCLQAMIWLRATASGQLFYIIWGPIVLNIASRYFWYNTNKITWNIVNMKQCFILPNCSGPTILEAHARAMGNARVDNEPKTGTETKTGDNESIITRSLIQWSAVITRYNSYIYYIRHIRY